MRIALHILAVVLLTLITQIGGVAYLLGLLMTAWARRRLATGRWLGPIVFSAMYAAISIVAAFAAPIFGRVPLPCLSLESAESAKLRMQSPLYCALNRHYVAPELKAVATNLAVDMDRRFPGTVTVVLDAGFPFVDGFPMFPHLSHDDGRKLDLAFYYRDEDGKYLPGATRSPIGYWAFEEPDDGKSACSGRDDLLTLRWSVPWFEPLRRDYGLDSPRTRAAVLWLVTTGRNSGVSRLFLEPHLVKSLSLDSGILRIQGCRAARHDDHLHLEIRAD